MLGAGAGEVVDLGDAGGEGLGGGEVAEGEGEGELG